MMSTMRCLRDTNNMDQYHYVRCHHPFPSLYVLMHALSALFSVTETLGNLTATESATSTHTYACPQRRRRTSQLSPRNSTALFHQKASCEGETNKLPGVGTYGIVAVAVFHLAHVHSIFDVSGINSLPPRICLICVLQRRGSSLHFRRSVSPP